jgi:ribosomal 50S subunit-associated protein YjgA (DUF615 family)
MERILIEDFVSEAIQQIADISDEQKQQLITKLLRFASLEDIKNCIKEVSRG